MLVWLSSFLSKEKSTSAEAEKIKIDSNLSQEEKIEKLCALCAELESEYSRLGSSNNSLWNSCSGSAPQYDAEWTPASTRSSPPLERTASKKLVRTMTKKMKTGINRNSRLGGMLETLLNREKILDQNLLSEFGQGEDQAELGHWLNNLLTILWPTMNKSLQQKVETTFEPMIREMLPSWMKSLTISKFSLGETPVEMHNFRTVKKLRRDSPNFGAETRESIQILVDVVYEGDCDFLVSFKGVSVGAKSIGFFAPVVIELAGLTPMPPLVSCITASFLAPPVVEVDWTGVADLLDWVGVVQDLVRNIIVQQISNMLLLPQRIVVPLISPYDLPYGLAMGSLSHPIPDGFLTMKVVRANNLPATDFHIIRSRASSDPYVVVKLGKDQEWRSRVINCCLEPEFDEVMAPEMLVESMEQILEIQIFDKDLTSADDFMGKVSLSILTLLGRALESKDGNVVLQLMDETGTKTAQGTVTVAPGFKDLHPQNLESAENEIRGFDFRFSPPMTMKKLILVDIGSCHLPVDSPISDLRNQSFWFETFFESHKSGDVVKKQTLPYYPYIETPDLKVVEKDLPSSSASYPSPSPGDSPLPVNAHHTVYMQEMMSFTFCDEVAGGLRLNLFTTAFSKGKKAVGGITITLEEGRNLWVQRTVRVPCSLGSEGEFTFDVDLLLRDLSL